MPNPVLTRLADERDRVHEQVDELLAAVEAEERDPSDAERSLLERQRARLDELEPQIVQLVELEERRRDARDAGALVRRRQTPAEPTDPDTPPDGEGGEGDEGEASYRTFAQYARDEILVRFDKVGAYVGREARERAAQRLTRAPAQVLTSDVPGMLPPQYLRNFMQVIDRSRPLVDASNRQTLTAGKIQFPRITERPEVAKQTAEKTEAGDGSMTVTFEDVLAETFLVAANFSWQTIQWSSPDALALWFDLAAASYAKTTDAVVGALLADADTGETAVDSDDLAGWMAAVSAAAGEVYANTGRYANTIAANPADAYPLLALVATESPVFLATGPANLSTGTFPTIGGLRFVASPGIEAGGVIVGDFSALLTAENAGAPVELRAVEPSIGGIEVGIIGAFAAEITDPGAFAEITPPAVGP